MSKIHLYRKEQINDATIGYMEVFDQAVWTLEDVKRAHKVHGQTRIPAGCYNLELRTEGGMTQRYENRFPDMHQGMVWLRHVPFFDFIYIHIGNTAKDTEGCILVGLARNEDRIVSSVAAYKLIYPRIVKSILDEGCCLIIHDEE
jgi:hypothetical protein